LGLRRLKKLIGTGFAHPKIMGERIIISRNGRSTVPTGSIWARGFKVNLPAYFAVGSPNL
jgi:hypothetical protein